MQLICSKQRSLAVGSNAVHSGCTRLGRCQQKLKPFQAFRADDSNTPNTSASDSSARTLADLAGHTNRTSPPPADQQSAVVSQGSSWRASTANTDSVQPLWRKPSFPFVVVIALATLPYDLAYQQYKSRSGGKAAYSPSAPSSRTPASTGHSSSSSSSRSGLSSRPARHAKPQATAEHDQTPLSAPSSNIDVVKREAAAAAAAVGSNHSQQQQQQQQQQSPVGTINHGKASSARKLAAEASQAARAAKSAAAVAKGAASRSSSAAQAAADKQANTAGARSAAANAEAPPASSVSPSWGAAAGSAGPPAAAAAAAVPVDSWDVSDDSAMFSDEDAEQHAKAMVIELLTHPKDTEEALLRAAASGPDGDGSAGGPLSVSPDYIDALVEAVRDPGAGMPHHDAPPSNKPPQMTSNGSSSSSSSSADNPGTSAASRGSKAQASAAAQDSQAVQSAASGGQQLAAGEANNLRRQARSASLWSWFDASPNSSQEEF